MRAKSKVSCIDARSQDSQPKHVAPKNPTLTYKTQRARGSVASMQASGPKKFWQLNRSHNLPRVGACRHSIASMQPVFSEAFNAGLPRQHSDQGQGHNRIGCSLDNQKSW